MQISLFLYDRDIANYKRDICVLNRDIPIFSLRYLNFKHVPISNRDICIKEQIRDSLK